MTDQEIIDLITEHRSDKQVFDTKQQELGELQQKINNDAAEILRQIDNGNIAWVDSQDITTIASKNPAGVLEFKQYRVIQNP